jgi:hypothetical protein
MNAIVITHCQAFDSKEKLNRTLSHLSNRSTIIIVDDSGQDKCTDGYYDEYENRCSILVLKYNKKSLQARKRGAWRAKEIGCDTIQFIDSGDILVDDDEYYYLVNLIRKDEFDFGIYPQITNLSPDIYYSRLGTCRKPDRIQRSILEMSLSCSMCMKVYNIDLVLKVYENWLDDWEVYDLDDYYFNICYAKLSNSLTSIQSPHYIYYIDGDSNTPKDLIEVRNRYNESYKLIKTLVHELYDGVFPEEVLNYWINERLKTYYLRMNKDYEHFQ